MWKAYLNRGAVSQVGAEILTEGWLRGPDS